MNSTSLHRSLLPSDGPMPSEAGFFNASHRPPCGSTTVESPSWAAPSHDPGEDVDEGGAGSRGLFFLEASSVSRGAPSSIDMTTTAAHHHSPSAERYPARLEAASPREGPPDTPSLFARAVPHGGTEELPALSLAASRLRDEGEYGSDGAPSLYDEPGAFYSPALSPATGTSALPPSSAAFCSGCSPRHHAGMNDPQEGSSSSRLEALSRRDEPEHERAAGRRDGAMPTSSEGANTGGGGLPVPHQEASAPPWKIPSSSVATGREAEAALVLGGGRRWVQGPLAKGPIRDETRRTDDVGSQRCYGERREEDVRRPEKMRSEPLQQRRTHEWGPSPARAAPQTATGVGSTAEETTGRRALGGVGMTTRHSSPMRPHTTTTNASAESPAGASSSAVGRGGGGATSRTAAAAPPPGWSGSAARVQEDAPEGLIAQRQRELQQTVAFQLETLQRTIEDREAELAVTQRQMDQLEEDYRFNLSLISERDEALEAAAKDLGALYAECTAAKQLAQTRGTLLATAEAEKAALQETVQRLEVERERSQRQWHQQESAKQRFFSETFAAEERRLAEKSDEQHRHYMGLVAEVEAERARVEEMARRLEDRASQQQEQREQESVTLRERLEHAIAAQEEANGAREKWETSCRALERELHLQSQRHQIAIETLTKSKGAELQQCMKEVDQRIEAVESALRSAVQGKATAEQTRDGLERELLRVQQALERETGLLQEELTEAQRQRSHAEAQLREVTAQLQHRQHDVEALERKRAVAVESVEEVCQQLRVQCQELKREVEAAHTAEAAHTHALREAQSEAQRLRTEVAHWKALEEHAASQSKAQLTTTTHRLEEYESVVQQLKTSLTEQQARHHEQLENAQVETARLRRELHASETARFTLEEQLQLLRDRDGTERLAESLRAEKEVLAKRVMELEHVNEQVRSQVSTFTLELQSDPVLKDAKANAARVQQLQRELLEAKSCEATLKDSLAEREAEVASVKVQVLHLQREVQQQQQQQQQQVPREQRWDEEGMTRHSGLPHTALALRQLQQEHDVLQTMYDNLRRELAEGQRSRRSRYLSAADNRRGQAVESSWSGSCSCTSRSSTSPHHHSSSSSSVRSGGSEARVRSVGQSPPLPTPPRRPSSLSLTRGRGSSLPPPPTPVGSTRQGTPLKGAKRAHQRPPHRRRPHHRCARHLPAPLRGAASFSSPNAPVFRQAATAAESSQELEVWRRECVQLEQHLQDVLRQRDAAQRKAESLHLENLALQRQVQSLTELNTFLKAQWREHYNQSSPRPSRKEALEEPAAQLDAPDATVGGGQKSGRGGISSELASAAGLTAPEVAAAVALLKLLTEEKRGDQQRTPSPTNPTSRPGRARPRLNPTRHPIPSTSASSLQPATHQDEREVVYVRKGRHEWSGADDDEDDEEEEEEVEEMELKEEMRRSRGRSGQPRRETLDTRRRGADAAAPESRGGVATPGTRLPRRTSAPETGYAQRSRALEEEIEQVQQRIAETMTSHRPPSQGTVSSRYRTITTPSPSSASRTMRSGGIPVSHRTSAATAAMAAGGGGGGGTAPRPSAHPTNRSSRGAEGEGGRGRRTVSTASGRPTLSAGKEGVVRGGSQPKVLVRQGYGAIRDYSADLP